MALINHKKAHFNYEITDTYKAGMELFGFEVKSLRKGHGSLEGAYVTIRGNEAFLVNAFIPPFQEKNAYKDYNPRRNRKLLLTKKEIKKLANIEKTKNLTIIPLSVYNRGRVLKIDLGIGRGKKKHGKREVIKEREVEREIRREFKDR
ncbi:MAG: SsrA-binding protein SmpB [Candidatus Zambryskibacteria bacterium]|nr:SsrA-binding protein SmpB [Candidatus Zambryskibacteria bacterium]